jgi:DNA polymerase-3 subunit alpha
MAERAENGPFTGFEEFCRRMAGKELNRRAVESLIKAGAFDSLGLCRKALIQSVDMVMESVAADGKRNIDGQIDLFCMGEEDDAPQAGIALPDVPEFTRAELMAMERETTGLYLSGHPMDEYRDAARRAGAVAIGAILSDFSAEDGPRRFEDNQHVTVAGVVAAQRTRTTRTGSLMSYIQLEDDSGTMELLAFQNALDAGGGYVAEGAALIVRGRISVRDEKEPQLMVDGIRPISDLNPVGSDAPPPAKKKLWVKLPGRDCAAFRRIELILEMFPGDDQMIVYLEDAKRKLGHDCVLHPALIQELRELLGDENVIVK